MPKGPEGGGEHQPTEEEQRIIDAQMPEGSEERTGSEAREKIDQTYAALVKENDRTTLGTDLENWYFLYKSGYGKKLMPDDKSLWDPEVITGRLSQESAAGDYANPRAGLLDVNGPPAERTLLNFVMSRYVNELHHCDKKYIDEGDEKKSELIKALFGTSPKEAQRVIVEYFGGENN